MLGQAVQELGLRDHVQEIRVATQAEAERYGMAGSPTILLNGRDIARGGTPSLECRMYEAADGTQQEVTTRYPTRPASSPTP